jgi:hypothetical protein
VHEPIANCEICGEPIFVEIGDKRGTASRHSLNRKLERAATEHLASHPAPIVQQFLLRKHLDEVPPSARPSAVKHIYGELREMWGEADSRGVYTIDEVLGSPSIYRLWMDADRCTFAGCPHAAA